jgi:hypothetical protein
LGLHSVGVELQHGVAFAAVYILVSTNWWFANADMQSDFVVALWAFPNVVSFRSWFVKHKLSLWLVDEGQHYKHPSCTVCNMESELVPTT